MCDDGGHDDPKGNDPDDDDPKSNDPVTQDKLWWNKYEAMFDLSVSAPTK